jgi:hypothetical protein
MTVPSLGNFVYYVLFIDDYSRKTWIYFLIAKDEVFNKFQEFKALVENLYERKIKVLRYDNGGEYTSKELKDVCQEAGIKRELTTTYNPQQNEVAERKNRSIIKAAKAMIHDQGLPMHLWAEASSTVVYMQNRSPHKILGNKTPEEVFTGKKPEVNHLRIFRCPVFIHVPKEKRMKLEPSVKKGPFVGYSETSTAYRIYITGQRQIKTSRDVTFDKDEAFRRSRESHMDEDQIEQEAPKDAVMVDSTPEETIPEVQNDMVESKRDLPEEVVATRKRPAWLRNTLQEARGHGTPKGSFRESKRPHKFSSYVALMSNIIDSKPSTFDEAAEKPEWKDVMMEEYQSIMKNDVWEVVPRPEGKSVVTSKWIYKIKHAADDSIDKYKARFVARGFSQKEGEDYDKTFLP